MTKRALLIILFSLIALWVPFDSIAGLTVKPEKENVVASRLIGTWKRHAALTTRLTGSQEGFEEVVFASDNSVVNAVPRPYVEALRDKQIYLAGTMTLRGHQLPFMLTEFNGNPHLFFFVEGDGESFNLMLVPAADRANDLLFIGGDHHGEPFLAFERGK